MCLEDTIKDPLLKVALNKEQTFTIEVLKILVIAWHLASAREKKSNVANLTIVVETFRRTEF